MKTGFIFLAALCGMTAAVSADLLAEWDVASAGQGDTTLQAINVADGLTASELSTEGVYPLSQYAGGTYGGSFCATGWSIGDFSDSDYYSFSVTAGLDGMTLEGITLALCRGYYGGQGAENWELQVSTDGFATSSGLLTYDISASGTNEQVTFTDEFASAVELDSGETAEFRLYGYYEDSSSDYSGLANMEPGEYGSDTVSGTGSNVLLYGAVGASVIPEPMAVTFICGTGLGFLFIRRIFD